MMAADSIAGRANPWADLFDPSRKKVRGGLWDYIKENKDYLGQRVAVYRDERGNTIKRRRRDISADESAPDR